MTAHSDPEPADDNKESVLERLGAQIREAQAEGARSQATWDNGDAAPWLYALRDEQVATLKNPTASDREQVAYYVLRAAGDNLTTAEPTAEQRQEITAKLEEGMSTLRAWVLNGRANSVLKSMKAMERMLSPAISANSLVDNITGRSARQAMACMLNPAISANSLAFGSAAQAGWLAGSASQIAALRRASSVGIAGMSTMSVGKSISEMGATKRLTELTSLAKKLETPEISDHFAETLAASAKTHEERVAEIAKSFAPAPPAAPRFHGYEVHDAGTGERLGTVKTQHLPRLGEHVQVYVVDSTAYELRQVVKVVHRPDGIPVVSVGAPEED